MAELPICAGCGQPLAPAARFCGHCGAPVAPVATAKSQSRTIAIAAVAAVVAVGAIWIATRGGDDKGEPVTGGSTASSTSPTGLAATTGAPTSTAPPDTAPATTATTAPTSPAGALTETCRNGHDGFTLSYPAGWYTEQDNPLWRCSIFDPNRFVIDPDTEVPPTAVMVYVDLEPLARAVSSYTNAHLWRVLSQTATTAGDHRAVAIELVDKGEAMYEAGTRQYIVLIDVGERTFVVETVDSGNDYRLNKQVVDAMAQTLQVTGG
jgi:hypothetical protein